MKPVLLFPVAFALIGALLTGEEALALTLGRAQGVPLIGRALEISVPVTLDGPSDPLPECVDADVFYGDTRLARERVSSDIQAAPSGASIRLRSQVAVNEPVVTVYLQLGCSNRLTRRLVLFAEQPDAEADRLAEIRSTRQAGPLAASPVPAASAIAPPPARTARSVARAPAAARAASTGQPVPAAPAAQARRPASPRASTAASRDTARPSRQPAGRSAQARLKLEPLDLSVAVDPQLRMTDGMAAPGPANDEQRALAIALWRALNAQPQDLLRDAQRLQALETDLRSLRQSIQRNEAALVEMRGQLQQAKQERYTNPLVWVLAALALLGAAGSFWFWRRSRGPARQWWSGTDGDAEVLDADGAALRPDPRDKWDYAPSPSDAKPASRRSATESKPSRDSSSPDSVAPAPAPVVAKPPRSVPPSGFSPSIGAEFPGSQLGPRALKAEELHDVQQEADFFVSLGEYDRAIELLRSHIAANPQTSAVAWLDLMDIFHMLGRRMEYDEVRREFQGLFNAQVPQYDNYADEMPGLEDYPGAIERICILWPHPRVLEVIEESIFRGPATDGSQAFSLMAYRDLLMLHHIGTEALSDMREDDPVRLPSFTGGGPGNAGDDGEDEAAPGFAPTSISPLLAVTGQSQATDATQAVEASEPLPEIGLDIDLGDLSADEPLIGKAAPVSPPVEPPPGENGHMLDFDLPEIDMSSMTTKKTRE